MRKSWMLLLLLAASCARGPSGPASGRVRIAVGGQNQLVYLPTSLAAELDFYRAEGLEVSLQDFPGGAKALEAMLGGSADVVSGFYDHTIQMAAEGRDLQAFVTIIRYQGMVLAASPTGARRVRRIEDLKGATVGVTAPGSSTHFFLNYLLTRHGLQPADVSAIGIGAAAGAVAAVERAKVDAAVLTDPALALLQKRAPGIILLADTRTREGVREVFGLDAYPASVLYAPRAWIDKNPDTARRLARAIVRTLQWITQHKPEEIAARAPAPARGEDAALYAEALAHSVAMYSPDGKMPEDAAEGVRKVLAVSLEKVRNTNIDVSKTYTNRFVGP